jgi:hypothetical protein
MNPDNELAQWAGLFLARYSEETGANQTESEVVVGVSYQGITALASELLHSVDTGGVPAFVTSSLKQIALENGIVVTDQSTPNEIIDAIRSKIQAHTSEAPDASNQDST